MTCNGCQTPRPDNNCCPCISQRGMCAHHSQTPASSSVTPQMTSLDLLCNAQQSTQALLVMNMVQQMQNQIKQQTLEYTNVWDELSRTTHHLRRLYAFVADSVELQPRYDDRWSQRGGRSYRQGRTPLCNIYEYNHRPSQNTRNSDQVGARKYKGSAQNSQPTQIVKEKSGVENKNIPIPIESKNCNTRPSADIISVDVDNAKDSSGPSVENIVPQNFHSSTDVIEVMDSVHRESNVGTSGVSDEVLGASGDINLANIIPSEQKAEQNKITCPFLWKGRYPKEWRTCSGLQH